MTNRANERNGKKEQNIFERKAKVPVASRSISQAAVNREGGGQLRRHARSKSKACMTNAALDLFSIMSCNSKGHAGTSVHVSSIGQFISEGGATQTECCWHHDAVADTCIERTTNGSTIDRKS